MIHVANYGDSGVSVRKRLETAEMMYEQVTGHANAEEVMLRFFKNTATILMRDFAEWKIFQEAITDNDSFNNLRIAYEIHKGDDHRYIKFVHIVDSDGKIRLFYTDVRSLSEAFQNIL